MKILVVAERLPSPLGGGSARQYNLIRSLADQHQYTVLAHAFPEDLNYQDRLSRLVERLEIIELDPPQPETRSAFYWQYNAWQHAFLDPHPMRGRFFQTRAIYERLANLLTSGSFDLLQIHQAYLIPLVPTNTQARNLPPILLDMHDILSEYERRLIAAQKKATHRLQAWLEWKKMARLERSAVRRVNLCICVSEHDRDLLQNTLKVPPSGARFQVVPNGVDVEYFRPRPASENRLHDMTPLTVVFTGSMNYAPNAEAVRWFHQKIFPLIQAAFPQLCFQVVGWQPPPDIQSLHNPPSLEVTGFVEDIRPYLAESAVVVVPLLSGSGTRLKILDAWAMGKAVVSTRLGAEGLNYHDRENIIIADTAEGFSAAALDLLQQPELRRQIGSAGRKTVEEHYSWKKIAQDMNQAYQLTLNAHKEGHGK